MHTVTQTTETKGDWCSDSHNTEQPVQRAGRRPSTASSSPRAGVKGWKQTAGSLNYSSEGALFTINKEGDAPTIQTEGYVFFGYIEAKIKAASGTGIISSIVLESDDLDEVDWEFLGGVTTNVQMNYFGKQNSFEIWQCALRPKNFKCL